jgi:hypothetical protein
MSYQSCGADKVYEDSRKTIAKCSFCKSEIKAGNDEFYGDEAYYDHGTWACGDCKDDFLKMFRIDY